MDRHRSYTVLDLFSGAGGLALGFHAAGCRTVGCLEIDVDSAATFGGVFEKEQPIVFGGPNEGDATNPESVERVLEALPTAPDLIVGGPPCQGFSQIGRAKNRSLLNDVEQAETGGVRDPARNQLYRRFLEFVDRANPLAFVIENVPGIRSINGTDYARRIAREASSVGRGYTVRYFLLNAVHFGVPQSRWRIFFVGISQDLGIVIPTPPARSHYHEVEPLEGTAHVTDPWMMWGDLIPEVSDLKPAVTAIDALDDLPCLRSISQNGGGPERYSSRTRLPYKGSASDFAQVMRTWPGYRATEDVSGHWYRSTPRDFRIFKKMAGRDRYPQAFKIANTLFSEYLTLRRDEGLLTPEPGTEEYSQLRKVFVPPYRRDTFPEKWQKLRADQPAWTLPAHLSRDSYSHIHYDSGQARTITIREAARLQSFPDFVEFQGNNGSQFRQIGNAVPPLLAKAVATAVIAQLRQLG